jgi:hypothetical protein
MACIAVGLLPSSAADPLPFSGDKSGTPEGGTNDVGCVILGIDNFGYPLALTPYVDDAIGFRLTEDATGNGLTITVTVIPSLCHVPSIIDQLVTQQDSATQSALAALP